ncbi:MAG TPA: endolytic transglycosylase MltG [Kofleriaceae bacterium]|jgi:UPF0755 protein
MSKRSFRIALAVVVTTVVLVLGTAGVVVYRALAYPDSMHAGSGADVELEIKTGMTFPQIARMLADKHVIDRPTWFRMYAMWKGNTTNVKTGKYLIKDNLAPDAVLQILVAGVKEITVKVTLPEGKNMLEDFATLEQARVAPAKDLEALARDKDFLAEHAITGDSVEGYLFPDTYEFRVGEKPRVVLERLIARYQEVWNELLAQHGRDAAHIKDKLHWSDRDILTMASIVEKEAVDPAERPRIAQVFINRLVNSDFKSHRLETDPTIRYGCEVPLQKSAACAGWNVQDRLHTAQLRDQDNPYNTYTHEGLPPGPISNPGRRSIEAVLAPDGSDYLYFVAKDARNHVFSRTLEEHKRNVAKYMK